LKGLGFSPAEMPVAQNAALAAEVERRFQGVFVSCSMTFNCNANFAPEDGSTGQPNIAVHQSFWPLVTSI
jgi:hypothetical protein